MDWKLYATRLLIYWKIYQKNKKASELSIKIYKENKDLEMREMCVLIMPYLST